MAKSRMQKVFDPQWEAILNRMAERTALFAEYNFPPIQPLNVPDDVGEYIENFYDNPQSSLYVCRAQAEQFLAQKGHSPELIKEFRVTTPGTIKNVHGAVVVLVSSRHYKWEEEMDGTVWYCSGGKGNLWRTSDGAQDNTKLRLTTLNCRPADEAEQEALLNGLKETAPARTVKYLGEKGLVSEG